MQCPKDQTSLRNRERETGAGDVVVMDVCPTCGGIWLDKGELERLTASESRYYNDQFGDRHDDDDDDDRRERRGGRQRRRGGFLGGLFGDDD